MIRGARLSIVCAVCVLACDVESDGESTGGIHVADSGPGDALAERSPADSPRRARGFVVVNSDSASANVSLLSLDGEILSESFISSSSEKPGLSAALSGDVVTPTMIVPGNEIVLIDRSAAAVVTWVNLETAEVRSQLSVATGYSSNPHDYVPYSKTKAFVTRHNPNLDNGQEVFDGGDDVLVVDPTKAEITGRIDLTPSVEGEPGGIYPRADRALMAGGLLRVLAQCLSADFSEHRDSRIVSIDPETEEITHVLTLEGMTSCTNLMSSPDGRELATTCWGAWGQDPDAGFADSGVVLIEVDDDLSETNRFTAKDLGIEQVNSLDWASDDTVALVTFGRRTKDRKGVAADATLRRLHVRTGELGDVLLRSDADPFSLWEVRCEAKEKVCFAADEETDGGVLHELLVDSDGDVSPGRTIDVDKNVGLPPRYMGKF